MAAFRGPPLSGALMPTAASASRWLCGAPSCVSARSCFLYAFDFLWHSSASRLSKSRSVT